MFLQCIKCGADYSTRNTGSVQKFVNSDTFTSWKQICKPFSMKSASKENKIFALFLCFAMTGYRFHRDLASVGFATTNISLYRVGML